jgi:hypothetical protein
VGVFLCSRTPGHADERARGKSAWATYRCERASHAREAFPGSLGHCQRVTRPRCLRRRGDPVRFNPAKRLQRAHGAHPSPTAATSSPPSESSKPAQQLLCDPGFGSPEPSASCPDPKPQTGWVTAAHGELTLSLFTTLHNDAEGQAYAEEHGEEFPFSNDYFDAPTGTSRLLTLSQETTCTGVILVGYREPLEDHVVPCDKLTAVARDRRVPVAVWSTGSAIAQVSELYRP